MYIWSKPSQTRINPVTKESVSGFSGWGYTFCQAKRKILRVWFQICDWDWWRLILLSLKIVHNSQNMMIVFVLHGNTYTSNTINVQWLHTTTAFLWSVLDKMSSTSLHTLLSCGGIPFCLKKKKKSKAKSFWSIIPDSFFLFFYCLLKKES